MDHYLVLPLCLYISHIQGRLWDFLFPYAYMYIILKFSFLSFFKSGQFNEDMIPTVGFNMRKVTKGNVTIKVSE